MAHAHSCTHGFTTSGSIVGGLGVGEWRWQWTWPSAGARHAW